MPQISKALRFEVLTRDGYRCRYCGASASTTTLHMDHVVPRAAGGRDDIANLVTACIDCNYGKSDRRLLGIPDGFALTPDKRPARMAKMHRAAKAAQSHELDCARIEEFDEINGVSQLCWVWCRIHKKYEWHSLPQDMVEMEDGLYRTDKSEVVW